MARKPDRRGEHVISRKPSRREGRAASAEPVCSCAFLYLLLHARPRVRRAPGFPCSPLGVALRPFLLRADDLQTSGATCRGNVESWVQCQRFHHSGARSGASPERRSLLIAMTVDRSARYFIAPISRRYLATPGWIRSGSGAAAAVVSQARASFLHNVPSTPCRVFASR